MYFTKWQSPIFRGVRIFCPISRNCLKSSGAHTQSYLERHVSANHLITGLTGIKEHKDTCCEKLMYSIKSTTKKKLIYFCPVFFLPFPLSFSLSFSLIFLFLFFLFISTSSSISIFLFGNAVAAF